MKFTSMLFAVTLFALSASGSAFAQRPDHFEGRKAQTLKEAVANFSEYNKKLSAILAKRDLAPEDMVKIHELTYTLENALDKIRAETAALAQTLEEVHVASERQDAKTVKARGQSYLRTAREIVR
jgi:mannitol-1-phosphate/altronate dehydrogenase